MGGPMTNNCSTESHCLMRLPDRESDCRNTRKRPRDRATDQHGNKRSQEAHGIQELRYKTN